MAMHPESAEDAVRARLYARFPHATAEVSRQIDLAVACAEHLRVAVTQELLESLVVEGLQAGHGPVAARTPPAVPLICGDRTPPTG